MTDRELLELAAKAAGIDAEWFPSCQGLLTRGSTVAEGGLWNPINNDGQALRLAVKLRMMWVFANVGEDENIVMYATRKELSPRPREAFENDHYAATRRAIVRAAAEIGRTAT